MKKNRHNLLSIGELAKLTGANIKSLRYYEKIGVLLPALVDPDSGYRYYTHSQTNMVYAIKFYVEMDIPLSELKHLIDSEFHTIDFKEQICYGIEVAKQRIQNTQKQIEQARYLLREIDRSDQIYHAAEPVPGEFPQKNIWTISFLGELTEVRYYKVLRLIYADVQNAGLNLGLENGVIWLGCGANRKCFVFTDVQTEDKQNDSSERIMHIPAQSYMSVKSQFTDIGSFRTGADRFSFDDSEIVILKELFTSSFDYRKPSFELRWSV